MQIDNNISMFGDKGTGGKAGAQPASYEMEPAGAVSKKRSSATTGLFRKK